MEAEIEPLRTPPPGKSQPIQAIAADQGPTLDDAAVRAAIEQAEAKNQDPQTIRMDELAQVPASPAVKPPEVPQKFLKPDGAVDVEKIQASTRQLDEEIAKKEKAIETVNKTIEDYVRENQEREKKFRNMPNAEKLLASIPPAAPVPDAQVPQPPPQNFEEIVRRDYAADPLATTARLVDLIVEKRMEPQRERERIEATRANLAELANKDPRILREDVFKAINEKIATDPDIASRKNPHKAAWLEVKEEMRLGDPVSGQAQPSRMPSPVLGGGTPPSTPSSSVQPNPQDILSNLHTLDLRKKDQEALGDEAVRRALMGSRG